MHAHHTDSDLHTQLTLHKLSSKDFHMIHQAAVWSEEQWGYVLNFAGIENRKRLIKALTMPPSAFYFLTLGNQPAGMFAIRSCANRIICPELRNLHDIAELDYVYTEKHLRGFGLGSKLIQLAKSEAKSAGIKYLSLDTMKPSLNQFYIHHGARMVCQSQYHGFPTDKLMMTV